MQREGEIVITFPFSYHAGFNHGFNCAESANFATPNWMQWGRRARVCRCRPSSVEIDMDWMAQVLGLAGGGRVGLVGGGGGRRGGVGFERPTAT